MGALASGNRRSAKGRASALCINSYAGPPRVFFLFLPTHSATQLPFFLSTLRRLSGSISNCTLASVKLRVQISRLTALELVTVTSFSFLRGYAFRRALRYLHAHPRSSDEPLLLRPEMPVPIARIGLPLTTVASTPLETI